MEGIRSYILSVCAAALLCAVLRQIMPEKGSGSILLQMVSGIVLAFAVIAPIRQLSLSDLRWDLRWLSTDGDILVAQGNDHSREMLCTIIKQRTEAYILDKAASMGASVTAEVGLTGDSVPIPVSVTITGNLSPYTKSALSAAMSEDLGIAKEQQIWIGVS